VFCANHLIGGAWRGRSLDHIITELQTLMPPRRSRRKIVKFWDSMFLGDADRVAELSRRIRELGLERWFRFVAETRAEDVVRAAPILRDMHEAGFVRIGCGVESPSRETHRTLRKGLNLNHVGQAAALLREAGIQMTKFLIVGHERETEENILGYPDYARGDRSPEEVAASVVDAIEAAASSFARDRRRRRRAGDRLTLVVHAPGREAVAIGSAPEGERERLVIGRATQLPTDPRRICLHLHALRLLRLGARLDYRRLAADALTLSHTPTAFRLRSLPGFAREVGLVLGTVTTVAADTLLRQRIWRT
jgi:hypothetical protein